jgi:hypothetical protein
MAIEFFNFTNQETYHLFQWISKNVDTKALIDKAFKLAEADVWEVTAGDTATGLLTELTNLLEALVWEEVASKIEIYDESDFALGEVDDSDESLWIPLVAHAFRKMHFGNVAQALLIRAGKWSPDKHPPDYFPLPPDGPSI